MFRRPALALSCAALALTLIAAPHVRAADDTLSDAEKSEINKMIHDYIMENPQIILDAVRKHQESEARAEEAAQQKRLVELREQLENAKYSPVAGNPDGNVTLVEFFDYRCGYCKKVHRTVTSTVKDDGNVKLVYKEFPILGPDSLVAARAALGVHFNIKDKYLPFHNALMQAKGGMNEERVLEIAASVGLDKAAVKKHMDDPRIDTELRHNMALAETLGIRGTPAFVINNTLVPGAVDRDSLENLIKDARGS